MNIIVKKLFVIELELVCGLEMQWNTSSPLSMLTIPNQKRHMDGLLNLSSSYKLTLSTVQSLSC